MGELLNDKQQRFCEEYLANGNNATQAAIAAGYSENTAAEMGYENLRKPHISDYIEERKKQIFARLHINQDRVLREYSRIAFSDIRTLYTVDGALKPISELDDDAAAIIAGIETFEEKAKFNDLEDAENITLGQTKKVKIYDKIKALDSLGEQMGMFTKKVDVTSKGESLNQDNLEKLSTDERLQLFRLKQKMRGE